MSSDYKTCKKCGEVSAQRPVYRAADGFGAERLERICRRCGYVTNEPCADAARLPTEDTKR